MSEKCLDKLLEIYEKILKEEPETTSVVWDDYKGYRITIEKLEPFLPQERT